jgi:hypothetical protein
LQAELSFRGAPLLSSGASPDLSVIDWEVAGTLISGDKVRKKNLSLQYCYEFRLRFMVPTPTGRKTQDVGEWCSPVRCILLGDTTNYRADSKTRTKYTSSSSSNIHNTNSGRDKKHTSKKSAGYSKYYDPDDYGDSSAYNHHKQNKKQQPSTHRRAHDPYAFQDDMEDEVDNSFVYEKGRGYQYKDSEAAAKGDKGNGKKGKKSALDKADEVDEDPELTNILSKFKFDVLTSNLPLILCQHNTGQSARMAWKWDGAKGRAGEPEHKDDYYRRHGSRYVMKRDYLHCVIA